MPTLPRLSHAALALYLALPSVALHGASCKAQDIVLRYLSFTPQMAAAIARGRPLTRGTGAPIHCQTPVTTIFAGGLLGLRRMEKLIHTSPVFRAPLKAGRRPPTSNRRGRESTFQ